MFLKTVTEVIMVNDKHFIFQKFTFQFFYSEKESENAEILLINRFEKNDIKFPRI